MDDDRLRGVLVHACAAAVLAAGAVWYVAAAPPAEPDDAALAARRRAVRAALPEAPSQVFGDVFELRAGVVRAARAEEMPFAIYSVVLACAGDGRVRAQLGDSGTTVREVPCAREPTRVVLRRGLSGDVVLHLTPEVTGPAVFGWQLIRVAG